MKTMKFNWLGISLVLLMALLQACSSGGSDGGISGTGGRPNVEVNGAAEKGPFLKRSEVTYRMVDISGAQNFADQSTETVDDLGNFTLNLAQAGLVNIRVEGYHFNEISGQVSDGPLALTALFAASEASGQVAKVNVMTHIIRDRILALLESGVNPSLAMSQAEQELLTALDSSIPKIAISDFSQLSIYNNGTGTNDGNAYLLLLSAALYQHAHNSTPVGGSETGQLVLILNSLADDFVDGDLADSTALLDALVLAIQQLDPESVITNLKERSSTVLGEELEVPDFSAYIGQFLITYPAEDSLLSAPVTINSEVPTGLNNITLELIIDGEKVNEIEEPPYQFAWNPYFWSSESTADNPSRHTLLLKAKNSFGAEIVSNLVPVSVSIASATQLTLLSPTNEQELQNQSDVLFVWQSLSGAAQYQLQLASDEDFENLLINDTTELVEYQVSALNLGRYYWRIRAMDAANRSGAWSSVNSFEIKPPAIPELLFPSDNEAIRNTNQPILAWGVVANAANYIVEVSTSNNFDVVVQSSTQSASSYSTTALGGGSYYWRVKSVDSVGHESEFSDARSFSIEGPEAPTGITSSWEPSEKRFEISISWQESNYAENYEVEVSDNPDFIGSVVISSTSLKHTRLMDVGHYYFRVRSGNSSGTFGEWSDRMELSPGQFIVKLNERRTGKIIRSQDGGYLLHSFTPHKTTPSGGYMPGYDSILKIDQKGNVVWETILERGEFSIINVIHQVSDGSILAAGGRHFGPSVIMKIDAKGELLWVKTTPSDWSYSVFLDVEEFNDEIILINWEWFEENKPSYLVKLSKDGEGGFQKIELLDFSGYKITQTDNLKVTQNGRLMVYGSAIPVNTDNSVNNRGTYFQLLDHEYKQGFSWTDAGENKQIGVYSISDISNNKFAVSGRSNSGAVHTISIVDSTNQTYISHSGEYKSINVSSSKTIYSISHDDFDAEVRFFNSDLTSTASVILPGFVEGSWQVISTLLHDDGTMVFLIKDNSRDSNSDDIIVMKRKI